MRIDELEELLGITIQATPQEALYEARLAASVDYVKTYCRNDFLDSDGYESIPKGAQMGIALLVKSMSENSNVSSQSLGDMSKSFFEGATGREAKLYLKPYVRLVI